MKLLNILLLFACLNIHGQSLYNEVGEQTKRPISNFDKKYNIDFTKSLHGIEFDKNYSDEIKKVINLLLKNMPFKFSSLGRYSVTIIYKNNKYYLLNDSLTNRYILIE